MNTTIYPRFNTNTFSQTRSWYGDELVGIILLNDDITTMKYVVKILIEIFEMSHSLAQDLMMVAHTLGESLIGLYSKNLAIELLKKVQTMNQVNGMDLRFIIFDISDNN